MEHKSFDNNNGRAVAGFCPIDRMAEGVCYVKAETVNGITFRVEYRGDHSFDYLETGNGTVWNIIDISYWEWANTAEPVEARAVPS